MYVAGGPVAQGVAWVMEHAAPGEAGIPGLQATVLSVKHTKALESHQAAVCKHLKSCLYCNHHLLDPKQVRGTRGAGDLQDYITGCWKQVVMTAAG